MGLQLIIGLVVFRTPLGQGLFEAANVAIAKLNGRAGEGARPVSGVLAEKACMENVFVPGKGVILAIVIPATITFVPASS